MATPTTLPASFTSEILTSSAMNNLRGAFRILQVVQGKTSTQAASSSNTFADTGLTATITPQSASSKVLVIVSHNLCNKSDASSLNSVSLKLLRGATDIHNMGVYLGFTGTAIQNWFSASSTYLDSPATTSATTYKTQFASPFNTASITVQAGNNGESTITLMEVSA
jgi:hypothetical protein